MAYALIILVLGELKTLLHVGYTSHTEETENDTQVSSVSHKKRQIILVINTVYIISYELIKKLSFFHLFQY